MIVYYTQVEVELALRMDANVLEMDEFYRLLSVLRGLRCIINRINYVQMNTKVL